VHGRPRLAEERWPVRRGGDTRKGCDAWVGGSQQGEDELGLEWRSKGYYYVHESQTPEAIYIWYYFARLSTPETI
jgi:hypothetical protein